MESSLTDRKLIASGKLTTSGKLTADGKLMTSGKQPDRPVGCLAVPS